MVLILLLANILSIYENKQSLPSSDYRSMHQVIKEKTHEERMQFFQEKQDEVQLYKSMDNDELDVEYYLTAYGKEWVDHVRGMVEQALYSSNVIDRLQKEEENLVGYNQFLENVEKQYKMNSSISIFQKDDAFVKARAFKTRELYSNMKIQMPNTSSGSYGIELLLQNKMVDILLFVFLCYLLYQCVVKEDENQHIQYMSILAKGKSHLYLTKIIAIWVSIGLLAIITYGTLYMNLGMQYGWSNLLSPIQSVVHCLQYPHAVSIAGFMGITLLSKLYIYLFFIVLLYALYFIFRRYLMTIITFLAILVMATVLAQITSDTTTVFSFLSPSTLLEAHNELIKASYVRVFSYAIPFWMVYIVLGIVMILLAVIGYSFLSKKKQQKRKKRESRDTSEKIHALAYYENKKIWVNDAGIIILSFFFIIIGVILYKSENFTYINDLKYNYYVDTMGNQVTQQLEENVLKEEKRFLDLNEQASKEKNQAKLQDIYNELALEPGFRIYKEKFDFIKQSDGDHLLIKEDQLRFIFENDTMFSYILCSFITIQVLLCMKCYERDYKFNTITLQQMNKAVGKRIHNIKFLTMTIAAVTTVVCMNAILLLYHQSQYSGMNYAVHFNDIPAYYDSGNYLTIAVVLLLQMVWQVVCVCLLTYIFITLFANIRYNKFVMMMLLLIFALPTLFVSTIFNKFAWI